VIDQGLVVDFHGHLTEIKTFERRPLPNLEDMVVGIVSLQIVDHEHGLRVVYKGRREQETDEAPSVEDATCRVQTGPSNVQWCRSRK